MKTKILFLATTSALILSCKIIDNVKPEDKLGGTQSTLGALNNTFTAFGVTGLLPQSIKVTELSDGVSTVTANIKVTDSKLKELAKSLPYTNAWNGDVISVNLKGRVTEEGIQTVFEEGNLTLVKFDAKVGDSYTAKINGKTIKRKVVTRTDKDDYPFVYFNIKVIEVEETGTGIPGVSKISYFVNHKFGIVGVIAVFDDGSTKKFSIVSKN